jgi:hypothetical protein
MFNDIDKHLGTSARRTVCWISFPMYSICQTIGSGLLGLAPQLLVQLRLWQGAAMERAMLRADTHTMTTDAKINRNMARDWL